MLLVAAILLLPPPEADVQGLYEGTIGGAKAEARVVALGKGAFKVFARFDGKKVELDGKIEGEAVAFQGKGGETAAWAPGAIKGTSIDLQRVQRKPASLGKAAPAGAVVLLDGKGWDELNKPKEAWVAADDGSIQVPKGGMSSKRQFEGSFDLHVEFLCPFMPEARGQGRGNSGCYLPNGDEIQVLDSFGMDTYKGGGCGGLYNYKDPDAFDVFSLASLPPLEWQAYDVEYRVSEPGAKPKVTAWHNGIKIHDAAELAKPAKKGGFNFQDHGNPVRYRNIWVALAK